jgi:tRNA 2-(methylsulfanyl)-N6-isopentenyladenosine37 hydroxylase
MLRSETPDTWFAIATADLVCLLSDHLHCERKAAENALSLIRRYAYDAEGVSTLGRLAHEETSHVVQVSELLARLGHRPRADRPNHYARGLLALVRTREPERKLDALLVAALIEARSHQRLSALAAGFAERGESHLSSFYRALATAEDRHAEVFRTLAGRALPALEVGARLCELAEQEAHILAALPPGPRIH